MVYEKINNFKPPKIYKPKEVCIQQFNTKFAEKVQNYLFTKGFDWGWGPPGPRHTLSPFLYVNFNRKRLMHSSRNIGTTWECPEVSLAQLQKILGY